MLGYALKQVFPGRGVTWFTRNDFDITDLDQTIIGIKTENPDYLIHAAAYTDVDGNELNPEKSYRVNAIGARNAAIASEETGCPIIYISTDYVFDGNSRKPYNEWDRTGPVNKYGLSKLIGERFVMSMTNRFFIIRTSWLYGQNGQNFVKTILTLLSKKKSLNVVTDQTGSPTYTYDLAKTIKELIGKKYGIYHITNSSKCSWYEFAVEIAKIKGIRKKINPVTSEELSRLGTESYRPARRPAFSVLKNNMLMLEGIKKLRPWKKALNEYLAASKPR